MFKFAAPTSLYETLPFVLSGLLLATSKDRFIHYRDEETETQGRVSYLPLAGQ